jgi:hypothetical protein
VGWETYSGNGGGLRPSDRAGGLLCERQHCVGGDRGFSTGPAVSAELHGMS